MTMFFRRLLCIALFLSFFICALAQNSKKDILNQELELLAIDSEEEGIIRNRLQYLELVQEGSDEWFYSICILTETYCVSGNPNLPAAKALLEKAQSALTVRNDSDGYPLGITLLSWTNYYIASRDYENAVQCIVNAMQTISRFPVGKELEKAMIINNFASILQAVGQYKESLQYFDLAETLLSPIETITSYLNLAGLYCNRGVSYRVLGQTSKAIEDYKTAEAIFDSMNSRKSVFLPVLYSNFQTVYKEIGEPSQAALYSEKSLSLAKRIYGHDSYYYAAVLVNTGGLEDDNPDRVLSFSSEAVDILEKRGITNDTVYYSALGNIGSVYNKRGMYKEAIQIFRKVLDAMESNPKSDPYRMAVIFSQMAVSYYGIGEKEMANEATSKSIEILKEHYGENSELYISNLINLAAISGSDDYGIELLDNAIEAMNKTEGNFNRQNVELLLHLGIFQADNRDFEGAVRTFEDALKKAEELQLRSAKAHILVNLAIVYLNLGKIDDYANCNREALAICEKWQIRNMNYFQAVKGLLDYYHASGNSEKVCELSHTLIGAIRTTARENISYMTEKERESYWKQFISILSLAILTSKDYPDVVYDIALMSKGLLLSSTIELEKIAAESGNPEIVSGIKELKKVRSEIALSPTPELKARAEDLENKLAVSSKDYGKFLSSLSYDWKDVQGCLEKDDIAVEFLTFDDNSHSDYAVVVVKKGWDSPRVLSLKGDPDDVISRAINGGFVNAYDNLDWYDNFWKEVTKLIEPGANIYFALDGVLHKAPLEYVPIGNTGMRMCDVYKMHRLSSTRELITGFPDCSRASSAAVFGGLDYDLSVEDLEMMGEAVVRSSTPRGEWKYLKGTLTEANSVAEQLNKAGVKVDLYTGAAGVESAFKKMATEAPAIIHVATHGVWSQGDDPMECSGLVFSGANAGLTTGILTAKEISLMDLRPTDLVVLSACSSGLGEASSDGVAGLQRAFKKAGAGSIVMCLWDVDDAVTAQMMSSFYGNLVSGQSSVDAFSKALSEIRIKYPAFSKWAAFVLLL